MKSWKVLLEYQGRVMEVVISALYYSAAKYAVETDYPGCRVFSIMEARAF